MVGDVSFIFGSFYLNWQKLKNYWNISNFLCMSLLIDCQYFLTFLNMPKLFHNGPRLPSEGNQWNSVRQHSDLVSYSGEMFEINSLFWYNISVLFGSTMSIIITLCSEDTVLDSFNKSFQNMSKYSASIHLYQKCVPLSRYYLQ